MKYTEYMALNPFQRFWYKFTEFFKLLPGRIGKFFCFIGNAIKNAFVGFGKGVADFVMGFIRGDIFTKLSYFIMGAGNVSKGQIIKGLLFFLLEIGYACFMIFFGVEYIGKFFVLSAPTKITYETTRNGLVPNVEYLDESTRILLFGVLVFMVSIAFIAIYFVSVKSARKCEELKKAGKKPATFKEELSDLMDKNFHSTLLATPIVLICVFVLLPLIFMILMAFTNYGNSNIRTFDWVGFDNFAKIFGLDGSGGTMAYTFYQIIFWTVIWAIAATFSNYIIGMVIALMINKKGIKLKKLWRTLFVMTIAVPQFVTLLLMSQMIAWDPNSPFNLIASFLTGETQNINLFTQLNDGWLARITVIIINCWVGIPYTILMTTGILMNIPEDLYESAKIDGAGPVKSFTKITLPYMLFVTTPYLITTFIGNINNFNVIYLLTGGGPKTNDYYNGSGKTDLLITLLYKLSVDQTDYGLGAAIGILVFVVCATVSLVTFNMTKSAKNEEEFS